MMSVNDVFGSTELIYFGAGMLAGMLFICMLIVATDERQ
jgi:hypothetical protein